MLTVEETAAIWKVSPLTVREQVRTGKLPSGVSARRIGRLLRFDEHEVINAGKVAPCPSTDIPSPHIGGYASRSAVERFASRQARKTDEPPKNSSTSSVPSTGVKRTSANITTPGSRRANGGSKSGPESAA